MKTQGRPTKPETAGAHDPAQPSFSGNKGLSQKEDLIFEIGTPRRTGIDLPEPKGAPSRLGGMEREGEIGLPGLTEPQTLRHYVRLSQKNYAIDLGVYPLGSWPRAGSLRRPRHEPRHGCAMRVHR